MFKFLVAAIVVSTCPPENTVEVRQTVQLKLDEQQATVVVMALKLMRDDPVRECLTVSLPEYYLSATTENEIRKLFKEKNVELPSRLSELLHKPY